MPYCFLIFNKNNHRECQKATLTSLGIKNKKRPLLTASVKSSHVSFYTASLGMMVKAWAQTYPWK